MKTKTDLDARVLAIIEPIASDMALRIVRLRALNGPSPRLKILKPMKGFLPALNLTALSKAANVFAVFLLGLMAIISTLIWTVIRIQRKSLSNGFPKLNYS